MFYFLQLKRKKEVTVDCEAQNATDNGESDCEDVEFFFDHQANCEEVKKSLSISTKFPTLGHVITSAKHTADNTLMQLYETTQNLNTLQRQMERVMAENVFMRHKLWTVRNNYNQAMERLKAMNPNQPFLKFRDDIRNYTQK